MVRSNSGADLSDICQTQPAVAAQRDRISGGSLPLIGALALITFVVGHQLIFAATYGAAAIGALARTGHDVQWSTTVAGALALSAVLAAVAVREIIRLSRQTHDLDGGRVSVENGARLDLLRDTLLLWAPTAVVSLVIFVVAENVEHVSVGLAAPGIAVLGATDYHFTLLIFGVVSAALAFVAALYRWQREALLAAIVAARRTWPRSIAHRRHSIDAQVMGDLVVYLRPPGRAPPSLMTR